MTITRGIATQCSRCCADDADIRRALLASERRHRRGLAPRQEDLDKIAQAKEWKRRCAELGHHDPQAGAAATWGNR